MILLLACTAGDDTGQPAEANLRVPELELPAGPGRTILWFTMDTLNEDYLGGGGAFDSSPAHDQLFSEAVVFENTVVPRGVTVVSLPSLATGTYPRTHSVQSHDIPADMPPMIHQLLKAEGWATFGYSANKCHLLDDDWTETVCTDPDEWAEAGSDDFRDSTLVDAFAEDLERLAPERDAFFWIHFRDPHAAYSPRDPWIDDFYDGDWEPRSTINSEDVSAHTLGEPIPEGFQEWFEAVYASQVRSDDELFAQIRTLLEDQDRWDIVVTGTDHGEELGEHHDYYLHGCSTYDAVLNTTFSIRAPGFEPSLVDTHVSSIDILPTMLELLDMEWPNRIDGRSLIPLMSGEGTDAVDVFFERGPETAGVVRGDRKYFLFPERQYTECKPFQDVPGTYWPGPSEGLFDLGDDPGELANLMEDEPDPEEKRAVCEWVTSETWLSEEQDEISSLVGACRRHLGL